MGLTKYLLTGMIIQVGGSLDVFFLGGLPKVVVSFRASFHLFRWGGGEKIDPEIFSGWVCVTFLMDCVGNDRRSKILRVMKWDSIFFKTEIKHLMLKYHGSILEGFASKKHLTKKMQQVWVSTTAWSLRDKMDRDSEDSNDDFLGG